MNQRRHRPGDALDDYCPRERRMTNHAIVAMIDDQVKQTRCTVCDAEHEYKDGKPPAPRLRRTAAPLYTQVLDGLQPAAQSPRRRGPDLTGSAVPPQHGEASAVVASAAPVESLPVPASESLPDADDRAELPNGTGDDVLWRRRLIRAALPRQEGQQATVSRPLPEFTIRQPQTRGPRHGNGPRRPHGHDGQPGAPGHAHGGGRFGRANDGRANDGGQGRSRRRGKQR